MAPWEQSSQVEPGEPLPQVHGRTLGPERPQLCPPRQPQETGLGSQCLAPIFPHPGGWADRGGAQKSREETGQGCPLLLLSEHCLPFPGAWCYPSPPEGRRTG